MNGLHGLLQQQFGGYSQGVGIQGAQNPGAIQVGGSRGVHGLQAPDMNQQQMPAGHIAVPIHALHALLQMHGMGPVTGESPAPQPNFQQPINMQGRTIQGVQNPGLIPMQGSRGVPNIQSTNRRSPQIRF